MHLWLHLCSVHESDSCITSCQQSWWYNLRLHCVMIWCHAMSYHVIPDSSMCHSTTQQLSHSTHFCISFAACFCPRTIQGHPRQWMKTMAQSCAIWLFWLNFINFDVLCQLLQLPPAMRLDCVFAYVNPWFFLKRHKMRRWIQNNRIWPLICVDLATEPQWIHMVCFQHASAPASLEVESTDRLVRFNVPALVLCSWSQMSQVMLRDASTIRIAMLTNSATLYCSSDQRCSEAGRGTLQLRSLRSAKYESGG